MSTNRKENPIYAPVRVMKKFFHSGAKEKVPLDLNHAINCTMIVARNEWRYVVDLESDIDLRLPPVSCQPGEFSQTILNLTINVAHAIADVVNYERSREGEY